MTSETTVLSCSYKEDSIFFFSLQKKTKNLLNSGIHRVLSKTDIIFFVHHFVKADF